MLPNWEAGRHPTASSMSYMCTPIYPANYKLSKHIKFFNMKKIKTEQLHPFCSKEFHETQFSLCLERPT